MCLVVVVTSGKGGVGKTTAAANIAVSLAQLGNRVAAVDTDIGLRNLDVILGLEERIVYDIVDVVEQRCAVAEALVTHPVFNNLKFLPAAQTRDKHSVEPAQMLAIVDAMRPDFDYIMIDCPAGIERGFRNAVAAADKALVVTNPEVSAVRDADRVIGLLAAYDMPKPGLIINKVRPKMVRRGDMLTVDDVTSVLDTPLLGVVPDDEAVIRCANLGCACVEGEGPAARAYKNIARRLMGRSVEIAPVCRPSWKTRLLGGVRF